MELSVHMKNDAHDLDTNVITVDQVVREVLTGYCRDLPCEVVERVLMMYKRYGELVALEAAVIAVKTGERVKQF